MKNKFRHLITLCSIFFVLFTLNTQAVFAAAEYNVTLSGVTLVTNSTKYATFCIWQDGQTFEDTPYKTVSAKQLKFKQSVSLPAGKYNYILYQGASANSTDEVLGGGFFTITENNQEIWFKRFKISVRYDELPDDYELTGTAGEFNVVTNKEDTGFFYVDNGGEFVRSGSNASRTFSFVAANTVGSGQLSVYTYYVPENKNFLSLKFQQGYLNNTSGNISSTTINVLPRKLRTIRVPTAYADYFSLYEKGTRHYVPFVKYGEYAEGSTASVMLMEKVEQNDGYTDFIYAMPEYINLHYTIEGPGLIKLSRELSYNGINNGDVETVYGYSADKADYENKSQIITDHLTHFELPDADFRILAGRTAPE